MRSKYKKLVVDGNMLRVFIVNNDESLPDSLKRLEHLHGIQVTDASPEEFLQDYEKRYGGLPDIGNN